MPALDLRASVLAAWRTNNRVTTELVEGLTKALWQVTADGSSCPTMNQHAKSHSNVMGPL